jgi:hypothetical protein
LLDSCPDRSRDKLLSEVRNGNSELMVVDAIVTKGDVMVKPVEATARPGTNGKAATIESVADILERELEYTIQEWLKRVNKEADLIHIPLSDSDRTGHLPYLMHDVITRLRLDAGTKAAVSKAAAKHGDLRRKQGYTVAMMVEESRLLQVSIFTTLHENVTQLEFDALLPDVVTIADEVDAQLKEQMLRFMAADAAEKKKGN